MNGDEWGIERFTLESTKIELTWATLPPAEKTVEKMKALVARFPPLYQASALALLKCGYDARAVEMHRQDLEYAERKAKMNMERIKAEREWRREGRAFWVGVCLLLVTLACSLFLHLAKDAPASLYLRITAAAGVGMMIAFLPGLFSLDSEVNIKRNKNVIRATGGFAAIVLVYLFDPGWLSSLLSWHKH
jgi:hypothetical protein